MDPKKQQKQPKAKKEKTQEEKEEARKKAAMKKQLKKEQAMKEAQKNEGATIEKKEEKTEKKKKEEPKKEPTKKEEPKTITNIKKKLYALTTYEERMDEIKKEDHKTKPKKITSGDIIKMLSQEPFEYINVNEEIINALVNISKAGLHKQATLCLDLLNGLKKFVKITKGDDNYQVINELRSLFDRVVKIVYQITNVSGGLDNTCHYIKKIKNAIYSLQKVSAAMIREVIIDKIDEFINKKINTKGIIADRTGSQLINQNDVLLIYGKSKIFRTIIENAVKKGIKFKVIFVDDVKENQMRREIQHLSKLGISVTYTHLNGVSGVINSVTKVFIKGKAMLFNGNLQGQTGTALLACIANYFKKPVIAFCQTYKFWDKIIVNSSEEDNCKRTVVIDENDQMKYNQLEFQYDITPAKYIKMVVCEVGPIFADYVPVIIKEFAEKEIDLGLNS